MSSGALVQLGAIGKQDALTTLSPSLSFWKSVSKRHTNFAVTPVQLEFSGTTDYGKKSTALLPRNGDLLAKVWLRWDVAPIASAGSDGAMLIEDYGRGALEEVTLDIGSVTFDRLYPEFMHAWNELTSPYEKRCDQLTLKAYSKQLRAAWSTETRQICVELPFYFCEEYGQALPLVALHLTDVKISVKLKTKAECIITPNTERIDVQGQRLVGTYTAAAGDAEISNMHLLAELVYLDDLERSWFADSKMSYVITQTQFLGSHSVAAGVTSTNIALDLNHPVKELIFMVRMRSRLRDFDYFNFDGQKASLVAHLESGEDIQDPAAAFVEQDGESFKSLILKLNGSERISEREAFYFSNIQPARHHTVVPAGQHGRMASEDGNPSMIPKRGIYCYSFALDPQSSQPSGSLNFSRIDTARMTLNFSSQLNEAADVLVFARSINQATVGKGVCLLSYATL
jgi:hypothetical protein